MREMIQYVKKGNKIKVKDRHGNTVSKHTAKKGIFIATPSDEDPSVLYIGWSLCNINAGDRFNKFDAYMKANSRAYVWGTEERDWHVPDSIKGSFFTFVKRAKRYFKQCSVPKWVNHVYQYDFNSEETYEAPKVKQNRYKVYKENFNCISSEEVVNILYNKNYSILSNLVHP